MEIRQYHNASFMHLNCASEVKKGIGFLLFCAALLASCGQSSQTQGAQAAGPMPPKPYPVLSMQPESAVLNTEYPATIKGIQDIEIRPKVDGYIQQIFVDEGSVVKKGQLLFKLNAPQYEQDVRTETAAIKSAEADVNSAQMQVNKVRPMVEKEIISKYELESDEYTLQSKQAALAQAKASLANAKTNLGYTYVRSPVSGIVGTIPYRLGSLITTSTTQPLTTVSDVKKVYVYFSMNEKQFLDFSKDTKGKTTKSRLKTLDEVVLVLSDGTVYAQNGHIETVSGLIDAGTGSATFRAAFPNPAGLIRSGGSAVLRIPKKYAGVLLVPQQSTYELQGKRFVYLLTDSNKVKSTEVQTMDLTAGQFFVVENGLKAGDKIVTEGTGTLKDGTKIVPQPVDAGKLYSKLN